MKRIISVVLLLLTITVFFCGCGTTTMQTNDTNTDSASTIEPTKEDITLSFEDNSINDVLKIYEESMSNTITTYCEDYLSYSGASDVATIRSIITEEYYQKIKSSESYHKTDDDYEQATALNALYYQDYSVPSEQVKVVAQCYQTVVVDNKSTTYNTFYIFDMNYDTEEGWLINGVDKPSNEYLKE